VILTRMEGRTPMPKGESLRELARHQCTLCVFLSITLLKKVRDELLAAGWSEGASILVVHRTSWPGKEKIVRGTLADIVESCRAEKIASQAMIIASPALGARYWPELKKSRLYDAEFTHRFRRGNRPPSENTV
jgi:precorrin-4/cobalt-precorrin-4 C11-methyltransferase